MKSQIKKGGKGKRSRKRVVSIKLTRQQAEGLMDALTYGIPHLRNQAALELGAASPSDPVAMEASWDMVGLAEAAVEAMDKLDARMEEAGWSDDEGG